MSAADFDITAHQVTHREKFSLFRQIEEHLGRPMPIRIRADLRTHLPLPVVKRLADWLVNGQQDFEPPSCASSHEAMRALRVCPICGEVTDPQVTTPTTEVAP